MPSSLNLSLTDELRAFVDSRAGDSSVFATPSEYLRDLIRKDMESQQTLSHLMNGIEDVKAKRYSDKSILDILEDD